MERTRRAQQSTALVTCLALASTAFATDDFYETTPLPARLIPEYIPCEFQKKQYACFDENQVVELFALEIRAMYWHKNWRNSIRLLSIKETQLVNLNKRLEIYDGISNRDDAFIIKLTEDFITLSNEKNKYQVLAENPPTWPLWVGGTSLAVGLGAFLIALIK